jgi:glucose-1-phosphate thymidylyltransferase
MKALILSGGKGTRLRPLTYTGAKQLVPVANKPILWYGIEAIVKAGIIDIGIIISPETGEEIEAKTGDGSHFGAKITYIRQNSPDGLAHAVQIAQPFLGNSPFVMYLGDNLIADDLDEYLTKFKNNYLDALILIKQVDNPTAFGVVKINEQGEVLQLVEKPKNPPSNLALVGIYFFSPQIHKAIETLKPSARGELEITDAIQALLEQNKQVSACELKNWWLDTGKKDDLLEANRIILDDNLLANNQGIIDSNSKIIGRVQIGKNTQITNSTIRGPVIIGENCELTNCFIGPYSSIADHVKLSDADLEHSVVLQSAEVMGIEQRIVDSVIGQRAKLHLAPRHPKALSFMIGDDSHIQII